MELIGGIKINSQYLRLATENDVDLLFRWANEIAVRENSFSGKTILYDEHLQWFRTVLIRENIKQYIFMNYNEPIGQVRIMISGEYAEISYSICAEKRGRGHGKELLSLLKEKVERDFPQVKTLVAKVKPNNRASQAVFFSAGYTEKYRLYEMALIEEQDVIYKDRHE